jgi:hypothetical protein
MLPIPLLHWQKCAMLLRQFSSVDGLLIHLEKSGFFHFLFWPLFRSVYLAVCPTVQNPVEFSLRDIQVQSKSVPIPFRKVSGEKFSVIACFSPLFYNERWQLIIPTVSQIPSFPPSQSNVSISFQLEIYRQFGVSLQIYYIQSMLIEILDFMRVIHIYVQFKFTIFLQNVFVGIHIHTQVHIIHIYIPSPF